MEHTPWLLIGLIWVVNFAISWWNARTVGLMWTEVKYLGGFKQFMAWMGAIMSASGFTWCYLVVLLFGAYYAQPVFLEPDEPLILDVEALQAGFSLGYLLLLPGILFSGLMIWINSLIVAWRRRDLPSIGIAGWNTFAQIHNTYSAFKGAPEAFDSVTKFLGAGSKGGDNRGKAVILVVILVILAFIGGILTTWSIVNHYAGSRSLPERVPAQA